MAKIFWDSNLFIYLFEDNPVFGEAVAKLRRSIHRRQDEIVTSAFTLGEILVRCVEAGDRVREELYADLFRGAAFRVTPFDHAAARHYARIRQNRKISKQDAIQLACAASAKVDLFVTNDERLSKVTIPGITFVASLAATSSLGLID